MSAYANTSLLKSSITSSIYSNVTRAVTGDILQGKIIDVVDTLEWLLGEETSRAVSVEATKATLGAAANFTTITTTGAVTVANTVTVGSPTALGSVVIDAPTNSQSELLFKKNGVNAWKWVVGIDGRIRLNRYDQTSGSLLSTPIEGFPAGEGLRFVEPIRVWSTLEVTSAATFTGALTVSGLATLNGGLTASTITNYAADVPVATLLALTPAQSAAKRKATVTGAYRMDGTIGRVEAWWDGDATAGTWEICGTEVPVTADFYTWAVGYAAAQGPERQAANFPNAGAKFYSERWQVRNDADTFAFIAEASGTSGAVLQSAGGTGWRFLALTLGSSANAYTRTKPFIALPRWRGGSAAAQALLDCEFFVNDDFSADGAGVMLCMHNDTTQWASNLSSVAGGLILCDPNNVFGYGAKTTMSAFCGGASGFSTSDGAAFVLSTSPRKLRILRTAGVLRVYVDGVQVGSDITTNLQGLNGVYTFRIVLLRPNSTGTVRTLRFVNATTIQVAP